MTPGTFIPRPWRAAGGRFRCGCSFVRIILATEMHFLARYSKRTAQLLRAVPNYGYQVSGSFHSLVGGSFQRSLTVLYAISLKTYLGLEVDSPAFLPNIQLTVLWIPLKPSWPPLRGYHPLGPPFPGKFESAGVG